MSRQIKKKAQFICQWWSNGGGGGGENVAFANNYRQWEYDTVQCT